MSLKTQFRVRQRQRLKRRKKRAGLTKKKLNPDDFFYGRYYIGNCRPLPDNLSKEGSEHAEKEKPAKTEETVTRGKK